MTVSHSHKELSSQEDEYQKNLLYVVSSEVGLKILIPIPKGLFSQELMGLSNFNKLYFFAHMVYKEEFLYSQLCFSTFWEDGNLTISILSEKCSSVKGINFQKH